MTLIGSNFINSLPEKLTPGLPPLFSNKEVKETVKNFLDFFEQKCAVLKKESFTNISFIDDNEQPAISKNTKVLIIGDSQTYGNYGTKLDGLVRGTGAKAITYASWGSSPESWFSGYKTPFLWSKGTDGSEQRLKDAPTPSIEKVLKEEKPDIVIVTMGGNMIANATQATVTNSVNKLGTAITASGAKLYWAGPPKYDPQKRTPELLETFYGYLAKAVATHGTLIDSRKFIDKYHGSDGLHYSGRQGNRQTDNWAEGVFKEIQGSNVKTK